MIDHSTVTWVVPTIDRVRGGRVAASLSGRDLLVVDNAGDHGNRGVAYAWNQGVDRARAIGALWLVICSEAMIFGKWAGADLEARLLDLPADVGWADTTFGWHLVAFRTTTLERVGRFDEAFPAYMEDTDYLYRLHLAGYPSPRENGRPHTVLTGIDAVDTGHAQALAEGLVTVDFRELEMRYQAKWGGRQGSETYQTPYDHHDHDWSWTPAWPAALRQGPRQVRP